MYNDSIDALLLRHYGPHGPTPDALEHRLINSVRQEARIRQQQERTGIRLRWVAASLSVQAVVGFDV